MSDADRTAGAACSRAWQTLRMAHHRVAKRLGADLRRECALAINEFDVLLYLRSRATEEVRIGALLAAVPLSQPALSRLASRLEERGLVARAAARDDGRAAVVCLTATGTALIDRAVGIHARAVQAALTGPFADSEQAALLDTLGQIDR